MSRAWIVVAAAAHVRGAVAGGFIQAGHGKDAPMRRLAPGDRVACYSPSGTLGGKDRLQAFTALGTVDEGEPVRARQNEGFMPWRRAMIWEATGDAPIRPLLEALDFTRGKPNWGMAMRRGLFEIGADDMDRIAAAMQTRPTSRTSSGR